MVNQEETLCTYDLKIAKDCLVYKPDNCEQYFYKITECPSEQVNTFGVCKTNWKCPTEQEYQTMMEGGNVIMVFTMAVPLMVIFGLLLYSIWIRFNKKTNKKFDYFDDEDFSVA